MGYTHMLSLEETRRPRSCQKSVSTHPGSQGHGLSTIFSRLKTRVPNVISTISPVPLAHQLSLGVTKPHEAVLLRDTADVDQPAAVQLALCQSLVPSMGGVREEVLVPLLTGETGFGLNDVNIVNDQTILPHTPNFPILEPLLLQMQ